ncbi:MAG TPA: hypothetical protein VM370_06300 [Candidatus Thermoplasmatota archaeon]|nr:hypothetical protein [Candidatus Thermoplasmatota archaeon]
MRLGPPGWALVTVTALFAVTSAIVYLITGRFGQGWLYASAAVYACVAIVAIALLLSEARERAAQPSAGTNGDEPLLAQRLLIYRTLAGSAWRLDYAWPDGRAETRHVAAAGGQMLTHHEIAGYVDALPPARGARLDDRAVDDAIAMHAIEGPEPVLEEEVAR